MARTFSAEVAATVRPWGLLTAIALGYAAYTLHTGVPQRIKQAAPRIALPSVQIREMREMRANVLEIPRTVVKCVQDGTVTYSDRPCAADSLFDVLLLPAD